MRCPKCGYNSFDYLDSCKKCGKDLVEFKQRYGIQSILFPGAMSPTDDSEDVAFDSESADAVVVAATGAAAASAAAASAEPEAVESQETSSTEADDFGFDFMGDSAEDDDLSFDELFEEAPEDEDVEESIEGPKSAAPDSGGEEGDDFSFDLPEEDGFDDDFGLDEEPDTVSFDDDPEPQDDETGIGEDPKSPFDLPESPERLGAPDSQTVFSLATADRAEAVPESGGEEDASDAAFDSSDDYYSRAFEESSESIDDEHSEPLAEAAPVADLFTPVAAEQTSEPVALDLSEVLSEEELPAPTAPVVDEEALYQEYYRGFDTNREAAAGVSGDPMESPADADGGPAVFDDERFSDPAEEPELPTAAMLPATASRIAASLFDGLILAVVGGGFLLAAEYALGGIADSYIPSLDTLLDLSIPYFLVLFFLCFGYFTLFHFLVGQTPGKMLVGLRVESCAGDPLTFGQAFLRSVGGLLQLVPAGLGLLAVLFNREKRGWSDLIAGTRVVPFRHTTEGMQEDAA